MANVAEKLINKVERHGCVYGYSFQFTCELGTVLVPSLKNIYNQFDNQYPKQRITDYVMVIIKFTFTKMKIPIHYY